MEAGDASAVALPARVLLYYQGAVPTIPMASVVAQLAFYTSTLNGWNFGSDQTVDPATITDANLMKYAALAMVNTCHFPFGPNKPDTPQSQVIQRFLQRGGGLFGTHCAAGTFRTAVPPALYNQLIGGRTANGFFDGTSNCRTLVANHPSTAQLPATFPFVGNLDNTDFIAADSTVLVKCTWGPPSGTDVAVSWYRNEGMGRVFYTNFAKVEADLTNPVVGTNHIVPGLAWVLRR
jgi:type 1 glutamine amidotransferase